MQPNFLRFIVPDELIKDFQDLANEQSIEISPPQPCDSSVEPLNAPVTGPELLELFKIITAACSTGTTALTFYKKVVALLGKKKKRITVVSAQSKKSVRLDENTNVNEIPSDFLGV